MWRIATWWGSLGNTYFEGGIWQGLEPATRSCSTRCWPSSRPAAWGTPEEIAYAVTVLASPLASFITGTNLVADGALTPGVQL